jgi:hypothetical protein
MKTIWAVIAIFCLSFASIQAETYEYYGTARDLSSKSILYYDYHKEEWKGNQHLSSFIEYKDPDKAVFATKNINFEKYPPLPQFTTTDNRDGFMEGAEWKGDSFIIFSRRKFGDPVVSKTMKVLPSSAIDGGFDRFVRNNWDEIMNGQRITLSIYVPTELDFYPFAVYKVRDAVWRGRKTTWIRMEIDQFILKQIIAPIDIEYDLETKRLIEYKGISNINGANGKSLKVWIEYNYTKWKNYP